MQERESGRIIAALVVKLTQSVYGGCDTNSREPSLSGKMRIPGLLLGSTITMLSQTLYEQPESEIQ